MWKDTCVIEDYCGPSSGYTTHRRENGWATPYVEDDVALRITDDWKVRKWPAGDAYDDASNGQFCFRSESIEDWQRFPAIMRAVEGQGRTHGHNFLGLRHGG
jgi:hypothetical protein